MSIINKYTFQFFSEKGYLLIDAVVFKLNAHKREILNTFSDILYNILKII